MTSSFNKESVQKHHEAQKRLQQHLRMRQIFDDHWVLKIELLAKSKFWAKVYNVDILDCFATFKNHSDIYNSTLAKSLRIKIWDLLKREVKMSLSKNDLIERYSKYGSSDHIEEIYANYNKLRSARDTQFDMTYNGEPYFGFNATSICSVCGENCSGRHWTRINYCRKCYSSLNDKQRKEIHRLSRHIIRTEAEGNASTLTLGEWLNCLDYFNWSCAYCTGEFDCIEHIISVSAGGGTSLNNCLPSCQTCNSQKRMELHPPNISETNAKNISAYFAQLG